MKRFWEFWILITISAILLMVALAGFAVASEIGWSEFPIELEEGWIENVFLTVENSAQISLVPLFAFEGIDNIVGFQPSIVDEGTTLISIWFAQMGIAEKEGIAPDIYRVKLVAMQADNKEFPLLIYLKLGEVPPSGNADNIWVELNARIDALEASLGDRIAALESALAAENLMPELETLREDLAAELEIFREDMMAEFKENENSPDTTEWHAALNNLELRLATNFANAIAQLRSDSERQRAADKSDMDEKIIAYATIISVIVTTISILYLKKSKMIKKAFRGPSTSLKSDLVTDDQIAMVENEISAMRERNEPVEAIKKKELELKILKDRRELEKLSSEQNV